MNIQRGVFRLTIILSILIGILFMIYNKYLLTPAVVNVDLPQNWHTKSQQNKLDNVDDLLKTNPISLNLSKIQRLNIRSQLRNILKTQITDEWDKYLVSYQIEFRVGWKELIFLGLTGFISVWIIYAFIRIIIFHFIVGGFKSNS